MSSTTVKPPPELEVLTFLSDPNAQVRQVALNNIVGFSAKESPHRSLLISKHKNRDGSPLLGRDGKEVDTVEDLKRLCQDQPITAHDAFSALINISDSLVLARKIGDKAFLEFLVRYIADPVSLLADLACMLLSNLTKLESICAILLDLQVQARPFYSFMASEEMEGALNGMDVEPNDPEFAAKKAKAEAYAIKVAEQAKKMDEKVPAMARLLDAFEEGATAASQGSDLESMKQRAKDAATKAEADERQEAERVERGPDGRPRIKRKTNCNFLASVFANVTVLPRGRDWFVTPLSASSAAASVIAQAALARGAADQGVAPAATEYPVARIMAFTEHPNLIRRGGVISTLKNVLFVKSAHKLLVAPPPVRDGEDDMLAGALRATTRPPSSVDILPYLLLPLCDGKELAEVDLEDQEELPEECQMLPEDKNREKDSALRHMLIESLLLLCTNIYGRQCLRARGAYVVVRSAHLVEADEKIAESVLRLVNILKRDESAATAKDLEDDAEATQQDVGAEAQEDDDSDDEALQIEEL
ncbi:Protein HGH1 [Pseudozyma hubeiensis]|nr:Protein HGH1 [Pseudozyma hubeiensis]